MVEMKDDVIYRQMAIDAVLKRDANCGIDSAEVLKKLPSAQPEPFTGKEQRIFLAAMAREELICLQIDEEFNDPNSFNLVEMCHEIMRKVKGALWT